MLIGHKLVRRETTRVTFREARDAQHSLWEKGYVVKAFAMNDEAGDYYRIIYERDEPIYSKDEEN